MNEAMKGLVKKALATGDIELYEMLLRGKTTNTYIQSGELLPTDTRTHAEKLEYIRLNHNLMTPKMMATQLNTTVESVKKIIMQRKVDRMVYYQHPNKVGLIQNIYQIRAEGEISEFDIHKKIKELGYTPVVIPKRFEFDKDMRPYYHELKINYKKRPVEEIAKILGLSVEKVLYLYKRIHIKSTLFYAFEDKGQKFVLSAYQIAERENRTVAATQRIIKQNPERYTVVDTGSAVLV